LQIRRPSTRSPACASRGAEAVVATAVGSARPPRRRLGRGAQSRRRRLPGRGRPDPGDAGLAEVPDRDPLDLQTPPGRWS
jgi:hypothetical protein